MSRHAPTELSRGSVVWIDFDPTLGREQSGHRPALVVSSDHYLDVVTTLAIVVPITTVDRGWPNHVRLGDEAGLNQPSWAIVEQPRAVARVRISASAGFASRSTMATVDMYLKDFLGL
ncbi:type II toxin-antitoxin system PemK/MazF family toxin [Antrihabitans cavernicola]|uniref:mRNA interferase n=1 Tax=Antrihabitans cavernicola TaxID=2495913 RepID=A0A5A7SCZ0_9NOCA|nr:type II toxin-antitoxin system PemK/MazF family toxin [Spelaeibacter cavernicola]KAA0022453.1 type II toxin-antitoxin system PemK/MazF family toxin [Spelaeibacter cavernicola]